MRVTHRIDRIRQTFVVQEFTDERLPVGDQAFDELCETCIALIADLGEKLFVSLDGRSGSLDRFAGMQGESG